MSVQELKEQIAALSQEAQTELMAFLFQIRHREDGNYAETVGRRMNDRDRSHWLSPDEFERRLNERTGQ